jgi:hypothetical protein
VIPVSKKKKKGRGKGREGGRKEGRKEEGREGGREEGRREGGRGRGWLPMPTTLGMPLASTLLPPSVNTRLDLVCHLLVCPSYLVSWILNDMKLAFLPDSTLPRVNV